MAESMTREGPVDVLESAVGVLRQAGLNTLVLHWAGSVPFALATLVFWKQATDPHLSDARCALCACAGRDADLDELLARGFCGARAAATERRFAAAQNAGRTLPAGGSRIVGLRDQTGGAADERAYRISAAGGYRVLQEYRGAGGLPVR